MISTLELARICGVSQGTVDRALHGRAGVSPATRDRVLKEAAARGHRPHPAAREILTGRSPIVQAVLPAANNLFFMDLAERLASALAERGLRLQIAVVRDRETLVEALEDAAARRQRLSIVVPPEDGILLPEALVRDLPMAFLLAPCANPGVPFVGADEERTGRDGVAHLAARGHRRIAFLTSARRTHAVEARASGYRKEMKARKGAPHIFQSDDLAALPEWLREHRSTALFCHNDWLAARAILALQRRGVAIPGELSVLGIDDSPTLISLFPELSTLAYPVRETIQALLAVLDGKGGRTIPAPFRLVPRGTLAAV